MTFLTGTATNIDNLFSQLSTMITGAPGWTLNGTISDSGFGFSKGNVFVEFRYDGTSPAAGGRHLAIYQALGYTAAVPGGNTDDSGNGVFDNVGSVADATLATQRGVTNMGDGPFTFWFFVDTVDDYVHVAVKVRSDEYRHFGFGNLDKFGTWTGGEYAYGQFALSNLPRSGSDTVLIDGLSSGTGANSTVNQVATVHIEGAPGQDAASKWGISHSSLTNTTLGDDRDGNPRVLTIGGARGSLVTGPFGGFSGSGSSGLIPLSPINVFYAEPTSSGQRAMYLGSMRDVAMINIRSFSAEEEITIGSDTWVVFPVSVRTLQTSGAPIPSSFVQGIAYRKVA